VGLVALAHGMRAGALLVAAEPAIRRTWAVDARDTAWGSIVVAGMPTGTCGSWLVAGRPQRHPWGVPGADVPGDELAEAFVRHGPTAVQLASGPFVAVDLDVGAVVTAISGIVPLEVGRRPQLIASTARRVVEAFGVAATRAEPGALVDPVEGVLADIGIAPAIAPGITWASVQEEIAAAVGSLEPVHAGVLASGPAVGAPPPIGELWHRGDDLVWLPALDRAPATYAVLRRHQQPLHWLAARCLDRWLFAPSFERPSLTLVANMGAMV
jgi:hypothetical protein